MNIGFIGAGHMGSAIIEGLLRAKIVSPDELFVKGGTSGSTEALQKKIGFHLITDVSSLHECEVVFIATGAKVAMEVLETAAPSFSTDTIVISVATGHTIQEAQNLVGETIAVVHAIPNTPVSVNQGMIGAVFGEISKEQKEKALNILHSLGKVEEINERLLGTFGTVAGCSPAFVDIFMEALADGAVREGLPRALSYKVIEQMVLGTATLALTSEKHPGELKDGVTSPGGSTIKGVAALEKHGLRYAVMDAVKEANS